MGTTDGQWKRSVGFLLMGLRDGPDWPDRQM